MAAFIIRLIEAGRAGLYNVTGPDRRMSFGELLPLMNRALDADARFIHVSDEFLHSQDIGEFMELPLWIKGELAEGFYELQYRQGFRGWLELPGTGGDDPRDLCLVNHAARRCPQACPSAR